MTCKSDTDDYYNLIDLNNIFNDDILDKWIREGEQPMLPPDVLSWLDDGIRRSYESGGDDDDDGDGGDDDDGHGADGGGDDDDGYRGDGGNDEETHGVGGKPTRWCYDMRFRILCHTRYKSWSPGGDFATA